MNEAITTSSSTTTSVGQTYWDWTYHVPYTYQSIYPYTPIVFHTCCQCDHTDPIVDKRGRKLHGYWECPKCEAIVPPRKEHRCKR